MEKATVKRFRGVFLNLINLTAVICIVILIADIARTKADLSRLGSTKRATADGPITLLNTTVTDAKSTGGSDLNESEIKPEPEAIKPDNTANNQSDNSEGNTEPPRFLPKGILRITKARTVATQARVRFLTWAAREV